MDYMALFSIKSEYNDAAEVLAYLRGIIKLWRECFDIVR